MNGLLLDQLKFETDTWKRVLNFISDENAYLKNRFSSILKVDCDLRLMEDFEEFQNRFVSVDAALLVYKKALADLVRLFSDDERALKLEWAEIINGLSKIKDSIIHLQKAVNLLIWDFHRFLENELLLPGK